VEAVASHDLERIAVETADGIVIMDSEGNVSATVTGRDPVWSPDGSMLATVTYDAVYDYIAYTGRQSYPFELPDVQSEGLVGDVVGEGIMVVGAEEKDPNEAAGNGFTEVWTTEGRRVAGFPGTHPFFALDGVVTVGGFEHEGMLDRHPRLWSLEAGRKGYPEIRREFQGFQLVVSHDGRWVASGSEELEKTWIYDGQGRLHAQVDGGRPVFHPVQPVLMTNLYGHLRDWYLPRLRSSSSETVADILDIPQETWDGAPGLSGFDECHRDCEPEPEYAVELEGLRTGSFSNTPGTVVEGVEVETTISITRQSTPGAEAGADSEPTLVRLKVSGCGAQSERYRDNLLLLACATDHSWRIYDLDVGQGIDDPGNHHALIRGVYEPGLQLAEFSPDGLSVFALGQEGARIYDISRGAPVPAPVSLPFGSEAKQYDISDDSRLVAMVPYNGPAQVWNLRGERLATFSLRAPGEEFEGVSFFNGSRHLVFSGWKDGSSDFYIPWTVDLDELFATFNWLPPLEPSELERLGLQ